MEHHRDRTSYQRNLLNLSHHLAMSYHIKLVQEHNFSGNSSENSYSHLADFEETCSCLSIKGMAVETLRWKLFPSSLVGRAKKWYNRHVGNSQGDWDILQKYFCLKFFQVEKFTKLRFEIIGFK